MSVEERDRRTAAAGREGAQRAPRSGGRTADRRGADEPRRIAAGTGTTAAVAGAGSGARGARRYLTQGTAALELPPVQSVAGAQPAPTPRLKVAPPVPVTAPRAPFVAAVVALVVAGVLGILLVNTKTNENAFQIDRLREQQVTLDHEQQRLEKEIAAYENPGNLDAAARKQGLVKCDTPAYIRLPDGKVIGVPKPCTDEPAITAQDAGR